MTPRRLALAVCLAAGFTTLIDQSVTNLAVPSLSASLRASTGQIQWFLSSYSLTFGLALVPAGRLGDLHGRRGFFLAGIGLFGVGSLISGLAPSAYVVVLARLLQGIGGGVVNAQVFGTIQDLYDGHERSRAISAYSSVGSASGVVGPIVGGLLITLLPLDLGWRSLVVMSAPFAVLTFGAGSRWLPRPRRERPRTRVRVDVVGLVLVAVATLAILLAMIHTGLPGAVRFGLAGLTLLALVAFGWWERAAAARDPWGVLLPPRLVRAPSFVSGTLVATFNFGANLAQSAVIMLFLLDVVGLKPIAAVLVVLPSSAAASVSASMGWRLVIRYGARVISWALGAVVVLAGLLATLLPHTHTRSAVILLVVVELFLGSAGGIVDATNRAQTLLASPDESRGVAAGFLQLAQRLSAAIVVAAATGIALGDGTRPTRHGVSEALAVCVSLFVLAGLISLTRRTAAPSPDDVDDITLEEATS